MDGGYAVKASHAPRPFSCAVAQGSSMLLEAPLPVPRTINRMEGRIAGNRSGSDDFYPPSRAATWEAKPSTSSSCRYSSPMQHHAPSSRSWCDRESFGETHASPYRVERAGHLQNTFYAREKSSSETASPDSHVNDRLQETSQRSRRRERDRLNSDGFHTRAVSSVTSEKPNGRKWRGPKQHRRKGSFTARAPEHTVSLSHDKIFAKSSSTWSSAAQVSSSSLSLSCQKESPSCSASSQSNAIPETSSFQSPFPHSDSKSSHPSPPDPKTWTKAQVVRWLQKMSRGHDLRKIDSNKFKDINGEKLCQMTLSDFAEIVEGPTAAELVKRIKALRQKAARRFKTTVRPDTLHQSKGNQGGKRIISAKLQETYNILGPLCCKLSKQGGGQIQLWQFLLELLSDSSNSDCIIWEGPGGEFKMVEPDEVARRWGERKSKPNMNYDKLSRALRYYYDKNIMSKVHGKRYAYKFDFHGLAQAIQLSSNATDTFGYQFHPGSARLPSYTEAMNHVNFFQGQPMSGSEWFNAASKAAPPFGISSFSDGRSTSQGGEAHNPDFFHATAFPYHNQFSSHLDSDDMSYHGHESELYQPQYASCYKQESQNAYPFHSHPQPFFGEVQSTSLVENYATGRQPVISVTRMGF